MKVKVDEIIEKFTAIINELEVTDPNSEFAIFLEKIVTSLTIQKNLRKSRILEIKQKVLKWIRIGFEITLGILYAISIIF